MRRHGEGRREGRFGRNGAEGSSGEDALLPSSQPRPDNVREMGEKCELQKVCRSS